MATSLSGSKQLATNNGKLQFTQQGNALVLFDGTTWRLILGVLPDGTVGLAISKEGEDIYDAFSE